MLTRPPEPMLSAILGASGAAKMPFYDAVDHVSASPSQLDHIYTHIYGNTRTLIHWPNHPMDREWDIARVRCFDVAQRAVNTLVPRYNPSHSSTALLLFCRVVFIPALVFLSSRSFFFPPHFLSVPSPIFRCTCTCSETIYPRCDMITREIRGTLDSAREDEFSKRANSFRIISYFAGNTVSGKIAMLENWFALKSFGRCRFDVLLSRDDVECSIKLLRNAIKWNI